MIKFLDLQKVTQKYSDEIHEAVNRVVDSGWYLQGKENVEFVLNTIVKEIIGDTSVERLIVNNKKTGKEYKLEVSGVFIAVGQIPQNEIFAETVKLDGNGFILASEDCMTSHPGIFAAGDCRTKEVRQLTTAAADGAVAALAACKYIAE